MAERILVNLPSEFSDGSATRWPKGDYVWEPADYLYHNRLADLGKDLIEDYKAGEKYTFRRLPKGYRIFTKKRKDGKIKDRYVFGHPKGRFDSPVKFLPHFEWMMKDGAGHCNCVNCKAQNMQNTQPPFTAHASTPSTSLEEEDEPTSLHAQLQRFVEMFGENSENSNEVAVPWEGSPPWGPHELLDGESFKDVADRYVAQTAFFPRKGEHVLYYPAEQLSCRFDQVTQQLRIFDQKSGEFTGFPAWKAGVVASEPNEQLGHKDLSQFSLGRLEVAKNCYRIELYPDPDSDDKSLSHQASLIPLNHIRPLNIYHEILSGLPQEDWHESIFNALKVINMTAPVDVIELAGKWDSLSIRCRGIWVGPELFVVGDAVRILPPGGEDEPIDQILVINRIDHRFEDDTPNDDLVSIIFTGPVFTVNKNKSPQDGQFTTMDKGKLDLPASMAGYSWYPLDVATDRFPKEIKAHGLLDYWQEVPIQCIIGRLYDLQVMKKILCIDHFDVGGRGMKAARSWATEVRANVNVHCLEGFELTVDRIEALDIETLNGRPVGKAAGSKNCRPRSLPSGQSTSSSDRKHFNGGRFEGESSNIPATFNGKGSNKGLNDERREPGRVVGTTRHKHNDEDALSDADQHQSRSMKSVTTNRNASWLEATNQAAQKFISDVIAGNALPAAESRMNVEYVDEYEEEDSKGEDSPDRQQPTKRPRL